MLPKNIKFVARISKFKKQHRKHSKLLYTSTCPTTRTYSKALNSEGKYCIFTTTNQSNLVIANETPILGKTLSSTLISVDDLPYFESTLPNVPFTFAFDEVFDERCSQEKLYQQAIRPLVQELLTGKSATIICFGAKEAGKTYTLKGKQGTEQGCIVRAIEDIFNFINLSKEGRGANKSNIEITMSIYALYNKKLFDLLDHSKHLDIIPEGRGYSIKNLSAQVLKGTYDFQSLFQSAERLRKVIATEEQDASFHQRSFTMILFTLYRHSKGSGRQVVGKLQFIETADSDQVMGARKEIAKRISLRFNNMSSRLLSYSLNRYKIENNKLSKCMSLSMEGESKVLYMCCVSPSADKFKHSLSALKFSARVMEFIEGVATTKGYNSKTQGERITLKSRRSSNNLVTVKTQRRAKSKIEGYNDKRSYKELSFPCESSSEVSDNNSEVSKEDSNSLESESSRQDNVKEWLIGRKETVNESKNIIESITQRRQQSEGGLLVRMLQTKKAEMEEQLKEYEVSNKRLIQELTQRTENVNLREVEDLKIKLKESNVIIDNLQSVNNKYIEEIKELNEKLNKEKETNQQEHFKIDNLTKELQLVQSRLEDSERKESKTIKKLEKLKEEYAEKFRTENESRNKLSEIEEKLELSEETNEQLQKDLNRVLNENKSLKQEYTEAKEKLETFKSELLQTNVEFDKLKEELLFVNEGNHKQELILKEALQRLELELKVKNEELNEEKRRHMLQLEELELKLQTMNNAEKTVLDLKRKNNKLTEENEKLMLELETTYNKDQDKFIKLKRLYDAMNEDYNVIERHNEEHLKRIEELELKVKSLIGEKEKYVMKYKKVKKENKDLLKKFEDVENEIEEYARERELELKRTIHWNNTKSGKLSTFHDLQNPITILKRVQEKLDSIKRL